MFKILFTPTPSIDESRQNSIQSCWWWFDLDNYSFEQEDEILLLFNNNLNLFCASNVLLLQSEKYNVTTLSSDICTVKTKT